MSAERIKTEGLPGSYLPQGSIQPGALTLRGLIDYVDCIGDQSLETPEYLGPEVFTIRIKEIPEGPVPEEVRKEWVGVSIEGARELLEDIEADFTAENFKKGTHYAVPISTALPALLERSTLAARWLATRSPMPVWLFFDKDTVEVLEKQEPCNQ